MKTILEYLKRRQKQNYDERIRPHYLRGKCDGIEIMDDGLHFVLSLYNIPQDIWNKVLNKCHREGGLMWSKAECEVVEKHLDEIDKLLEEMHGDKLRDNQYWIDFSSSPGFHIVYRPGSSWIYGLGYNDDWMFYGRYIIEL